MTEVIVRPRQAQISIVVGYLQDKLHIVSREQLQRDVDLHAALKDVKGIAGKRSLVVRWLNSLSDESWEQLTGIPIHDPLPIVPQPLRPAPAPSPEPKPEQEVDPQIIAVGNDDLNTDFDLANGSLILAPPADVMEEPHEYDNNNGGEPDGA